MKRGTLSKLVSLVLTMSLAGFGCSEDATDDTTDTTTGSLSIAGSLGGAGAASQKLSTLAVTDYKIRCVTLEGTPKAGEGTVDSDGSFSLSISGVDATDNVAVGCFIIEIATSSIAATVAFDTGSTGMGGGNAAAGSVTAAGNEGLNFGEINFDPDKGTATVPVSQISRTGNTKEASGTFADVTGNWQLTCVSTNDDYGCPEEAEAGSFKVYLNQVQANDDQTNLHSGLGIWENEPTFTACGATEDLDSTLPAGWSAVDSTMNDDFTYVANPIPAAADVSVNFPVCGDTTATNCSEVNNVDSWGAAGGGTLTDADCQAMCILNGMWSVENDPANPSCLPRLNVNWGLTQTGQAVAASGALATEIGSWNAGTLQTTNALVSAEDEGPEGRFVLGELVTAGKIGTVLSSSSYTQHVCIDNGDNTGCTDRTCVIQENTRVTITQASSTSAVIEVSINRAFDDDASHADCIDGTKNGNEWFIEDLERQERFLMNAAKQ